MQGRSCGLAVLSSLALWLLAFPAAAFQSPQLADTTWLLNGVAKLKSSDLGGFKVPGYVVTELFGGGGVLFTDQAGVSLDGAWQLDAEDELSIVVTAGDVENFLEANLPVGLIQNLVVEKIKSTSKLKVKDGIGKLTFHLFFKLSFEADGSQHTLTYRLDVSGFHDVTGEPNPGSQWSLPAELSAKAKKLKVSESQSLELVCGPAGGLSGDRFELRLDGTALYSGHYVLAGTRLAMLPDGDELQQWLQDWLGPHAPDAYPGGTIDIDDVLPKFKGTVKAKTGTLVLKCSAKFLGEFDLGGGGPDKFFLGKHKLKGEATPVP